MKYVFFDIECADGGQGSICSFGYVITDERFNEIFSRDITINPPGKFHLTNRPGRPDVKLAYDEEVFRNSPKFFRYYDEIKDLLEGEDKIIIGHSAKNDAGFLNKSCMRYKKPFLNFRFVDTQMIFSKIVDAKKQVSLESALQHFGLPLPTIEHKSEEDARATKTLMAHCCKLKGCETDVLIEGYVPNENVYIGRGYGDAPDVDGFIFVSSEENLETGDFVHVKITGSSEYDLIGELVNRL